MATIETIWASFAAGAAWLWDEVWSAEAAGWAQAMGSVLMLYIALRVPRTEHELRERSEDKVRKLRRGIIVAAWHLEAIEILASARSKDEEFVRLNVKKGGGVTYLSESFLITLPDMIGKMIDKVEYLGSPLAENFAQLITILLQYNRMVMKQGREPLTEEAVAIYRKHLAAAIEQAEAAVAEMEKIEIAAGPTHDA